MKKSMLVLLSCAALYGASIEIAGQDGKKTIINTPAKKVVIFPMPLTSMYLAIDGGASHIAGLHADAKKNLGESFLKKAYPDAIKLNTEVAKVGFTPNVEQIISLKPDVVIQWGDQGDAIIEPIRRAGIPVVGLKYGTQELLDGWIEIMGKISGNTKKADEIVKWQHSHKKLLEQKAATSKQHPKIVSLQYSKNKIRIAGSGSYDDFYIRLAGGTNPASEIKRFAEISEEQLLRYNPDIIILGNFDDEKPVEFLQRPIFKGLKAVQNKAVYKAPIGGYRWGPPNLEAPLMWLWVRQLAYPNEKIDLRTKMKEAYSFLYSYKASENELTEVLNFADNKSSANYGVFKAK